MFESNNLILVAIHQVAGEVREQILESDFSIGVIDLTTNGVPLYLTKIDLVLIFA